MKRSRLWLLFPILSVFMIIFAYWLSRQEGSYKQIICVDSPANSNLLLILATINVLYFSSIFFCAFLLNDERTNL